MPNLGWKTRLQRLLLDIDARLDFGLFQGGSWSRELFERFSDFMDRFHVAGWRRWFLIEPLSEAATLGCVGMIGMLTLAIPAFQETSDEDWLRRSEIAVTFLDRYGNEVGSRGVKQNDSIPLEEMPDHLLKAVLATEDRRFYEPLRHRCSGHRPRPRHQRARRRGAPGRIVDHPAARQEPVSQQRANDRAQDQGSLSGAVARVAPDQERDPRSFISTAPTWAAARSA